ncbi:type II toxin-antitoxin system HipA family toxin [Mariniluteicoccus endophyticus]
MPTDPRTVRRAVVRKAGVPAALLERDDDGVTFAYLPEYAGPPVATTLPLDAPPVRRPAGSVPAFFAGLLPEGRRLTALRTHVKTSADDELSLLLAVGASTIGDVTVVAEGDELEPPPDLVADDDFRFADLLAETGVVDRVGLPGVQEKASGAMISLPVRLGGVAAIVKLDPPEYPGATVNEDYFLRLARRLRIPVARAELVHDRDGRAGLVVERFDRVATADGVASRAVEDVCQLLDRFPADKYAMTGEDLGAAATGVCAAAPVAARAVLTQVAYAWLTGNGDLHAKNLSVLQEPSGEWRVAPVYDIPSTLAYDDQTMALPVGGRRDGLTRRHFTAYGTGIGLPTRAVDRTLDEVLEATVPMLDDLRDGALGLNRNATQTLVRRLARRRRDLGG